MPHLKLIFLITIIFAGVFIFFCLSYRFYQDRIISDYSMDREGNFQKMREFLAEVKFQEKVSPIIVLDDSEAVELKSDFDLDQSRVYDFLNSIVRKKGRKAWPESEYFFGYCLD